VTVGDGAEGGVGREAVSGDVDREAVSDDVGRRDLAPLFAPRSVAIVGASGDLSKWGGDVSARLLRGEHRRRVYLVNGRGGEVLGRPAFASLRDLPEGPELVILAMPAKLLEAVVEDCVATGVKAVVAVTAMLGEMGAEGKAREQAAVARLRAAGAVLVGPNCLGVADTVSGLAAVAFLDVLPGSVGLISQSGGFGEELNLRMAEYHLGYSRFVAIGNQADVDTPEVLRSFVGHAPTRAVVVYAEELRDGRAFALAARELVGSGTPVVLVAPGRSAASARVARTHTGSLTSDSVAVDAACRAAGVLRVDSQREAVETLVALLGAPRPAGPRVAVVSDGGGTGAICADAVETAGLEVPAFSPGLQERLRAILPENAGCSNPVDFAAATYDPEAYERVVGTVAACGEVDAVIASGVIGFWGARFPEQTEMVEKEHASLLRMAAQVRAAGVPLVANTPQDCGVVDDLRAGGLPLYRDVESATAALARLVRAAEPPLGVPDVPPPSPPVEGEGYWEARRALADAGVPLVEARRVRAGDGESGALAVSASETPGVGEEAALAAAIAAALAAAAELGYPVALKAAGLLHKSDAGGVVLGIQDDAALAGAVRDLRERLDADAAELALERMAPLADGIELIVGCRRDTRFGPLLTVGIGGLYTELLTDTRTVFAPVDEALAERLLLELRGAPLLCGARGRPRLDVAAAARAAAALSRFAAAHPEVAGVEVNPVLVLPDGAVGLDARLVLSASGSA
jgi:acyl-CoA synthetase (NDP forming)